MHPKSVKENSNFYQQHDRTGVRNISAIPGLSKSPFEQPGCSFDLLLESLELHCFANALAMLLK